MMLIDWCFSILSVSDEVSVFDFQKMKREKYFIYNKHTAQLFNYRRIYMIPTLQINNICVSERKYIKANHHECEVEVVQCSPGQDNTNRIFCVKKGTTETIKSLEDIKHSVVYVIRKWISF